MNIISSYQVLYCSFFVVAHVIGLCSFVRQSDVDIAIGGMTVIPNIYGAQIKLRSIPNWGAGAASRHPAPAIRTFTRTWRAAQVQAIHSADSFRAIAPALHWFRDLSWSLHPCYAAASIWIEWMLLINTVPYCTAMVPGTWYEYNYGIPGTAV